MANEAVLMVSQNRDQYPTLDSDQLAYLLLEVKPSANNPVVATTAMPLSLALVLDRSGSMAGEKIRNLKEAAKVVINRLGPQDMVAVVLFDDKADVLLPLQPAANPAALIAKIETIQERGGTQLSVGLQKGLEQLQNGLGSGRVKRLLLLTDGETWEDGLQCRQLAQQLGSLAIPLTALGLGEEWNQALLTDLAGATAGNWDYIDSPDKMNQAFQQVVAAMQNTLLTNASLVLRLLPGVRPRAVWRVTPIIDRLGQRVLSERDVQLSLGDLQQEGQMILVELLLPPRPAGTYRLAQAEISYDLPAEGRTNQKSQQDIVFTFTPDPPATQQFNGRVMNVVEKVLAFKLQTQALAEVAAGNPAGATQKLRATATRLLDMGEIELAQQTEAAAAQVAAGQPLSPKATKQLTSKTRKLDMSDLLT